MLKKIINVLIIVACMCVFCAASFAAEYHYNLSSMVSEWGQVISSYSGGLLTVELRPLSDTVTQPGGAIVTPRLGKGVVPVSQYPYLILKAKTTDVTGIEQNVSVYWKNQTTEHSEENRSDTYQFTYGEYTYFYVNWVQKLGPITASGDYDCFMIHPKKQGYIRFCDIYLSSDHPGAFMLDSFFISASKASITQEGESIMLTPSVVLSGATTQLGEEVQWKTDKICGALQVQADGTAILTGKQNGTITVTATLKNDPSYTATIMIPISGQNAKLSKKTIKYMSYGNSIMKHPPASGLGWSGDWGMAATSIENDYVHQFIGLLEDKYGEGSVNHVFGTGQSNFETAIINLPTEYDYSEMLAGLTAVAAAEKPDIITVQYGDNSGNVDVYRYRNAMMQFVQMLQKGYPDAIILVASPFWGGEGKYSGTRLAAEALDLPFADLTQFGLPEYEAIGEYEHVGVAAHPNDKGMKAIANEMYSKLNYYLSEKLDPTIEYTELPEQVVISTTEDTIAVDGGTLALKARVLPVKASQDIIYKTSNRYLATVDENGVVTAVNDGTVVITATSRYDSSVYAEKTIYISGQSAPFTVTYYPNATDTVLNMPTANTYAKNDFVFDAVIPTRETYRFVGWALSPDGAPVDSVYVKENISVYAVWEKATYFTFERENDKEGFTVTNGFNQYIIDGCFMMIATGTDAASGNILTIHSPKLDISTAYYSTLVFRMRSTEIGTSTMMELTIHANTGDRTYKIPVSSTKMTTYYVDITTFMGTVTGFTLKPTDRDTTIFLDGVAFANGDNQVLRYDANTTDAVTGMPNNEYLSDNGMVTLSEAVPVRSGYTFLGWTTEKDSFMPIEDGKVNSKKSPVVYALWDKHDHWEFDTVTDFTILNMENVTLADGIMTYQGKDDPFMLVGGKVGGFPVASTSGKVQVRMRWQESTMTTPQIYYTTSAGTDYTETQSAKATAISGASEWQDVVIDLSTGAAWSGTLQGIRFDLTSGPGKCEVDHVRFVDSDPYVVTPNGATRRLLSDPTGIHIVRKGGTLAPIGRVELGGIALSGMVDDENGYLVIKGNCEIASDVNAALLDSSQFPLLLEADCIRVNGIVISAPFEKYLLNLDKNGETIAYFEKEHSLIGGIRLTKQGAEPIRFYVKNENEASICYAADIETEKENVAIIALFDSEKRLVAVKTVSLEVTKNSQGNATISVDTSIGDVKFFVFDTLSKMNPLVNDTEIPLMADLTH